MFTRFSRIVTMGILAVAIAGISGAQTVSDYPTYRKALHKNSNAGIGALFGAGTWDGVEASPDVARRGDGSIRYFRAPEGYGLALDSSGVAGFLAQHAAAFGMYHARTGPEPTESNHALTLGRQTESRGHQYHRFNQAYDGHPVANAEIVVQTNAAATEVQAIFADLMRDTHALDFGEDREAPLISPESAQVAAREALTAELSTRRRFHEAALDYAEGAGRIGSEVSNSARSTLAATRLVDAITPDLMIYAPEVSGKPGGARLAYRTAVASTPAPLVGAWVYIDAKTGAELARSSWLQAAKSRHIYDANGTTSTSGLTAVRDEGDPAISDADVDGNYDALGVAYDYFAASPFTLDSFDDSGMALDSYVDWSGAGMSLWDSANETFHFGPDGYAQAIDIAGHEYAHAVIDNTWTITSGNDEGFAIAESIADLFGEFIQWSDATPSAGDKWLIGESLTGGAIRDMEDPATYDDPSFLGSSNFYHGTTTDTYIHTNCGVGNKFWFLLTDGESDFRDIDVTGLGQTVVEDLAWDAVQVLPAGASYYDLYSAVRGAAIDRYDGMTTPTEADALESIDAAGLALGIDVDLSTGVGSGNKSVGSMNPALFNTWTGALYTGADSSYAKHKDIAYRVYVPEDGRDLGDRGDADWPLDVIILSHGAGGQMNQGLGWEDDGDVYDVTHIIDEDATNEDDIDGLALHWAKMGYIVVAPTYTKRKHSFTDWQWEHPSTGDDFAKLICDYRAASGSDASEFFVDRLRDLRFVRDNLAGIINSFTGTQQPFELNTSRIALAGHSFGAVTTMLAAGAPLKVGSDFLLQTNEVVLDLEASPHNWLRHFDGGTPGTTEALRADDWGPYIHADAYLVISGAFDDTTAELQPAIEETRENIRGHTYVRNSLMVVTMEKDPGTGNPASVFYNQVDMNVAGMINDFPAYGVAIDEGVHITPLIHFNNIPAWNPVASIALNLLHDLGERFSLKEADAFDDEDYADYFETEVNKGFSLNGGTPSTRPNEERRYKKMREYTLSFFDAHLNPDYDDDSDPLRGKTWLALPGDTHDDDLDVVAYDRRLTNDGAVTKSASTGEDLFQFQSDGNFFLFSGTFTDNDTTMTASSSASEFIVQDSSGVILMKIDGTTGDMAIRGTLSVEQSSLQSSSSTKEFIVRRSDDTGNDCQILLDASGNLKLRGNLYDENGIVTP